MNRLNAVDRRSTRVRTFGASLATGLATAALPIVAGGAPVRPQLVLGGIAMTALLAGVAGWAPGITFAAIALATEYAVRLSDRQGLDGLAILEAAALFTTVELAMRSLDARSIARPEPAVRRAAAWRFSAMVAGATVSAYVVLTLGSRTLPAPAAALALGLAAGVALLVAAELLRRRATRFESR